MAVLDSERLKNITAKRIEINGIVQGVGFRPFVYQLAHKYEINGDSCQYIIRRICLYGRNGREY